MAVVLDRSAVHATVAFPEPPPLALYVHLPWCGSKCPYCDFNSHALRGAPPESEYVDALLADLDQELAYAGGRALETIFIGGGTPSLFSARSIDRLLAGIRARVPCGPEVEITMEANPGSAEYAKFAAFRDAGVNRLSIGIQTFQPALLAALGRAHSRDDALRAARAARAAGFDNFNLDLMYGLPGQAPEQANDDVATAIELGARHLSFYQLTIEPDTPFYRHPPELPEDDHIWSMQRAGEARLADAGFRHYEVSAFAVPGRECAHNLNYWRFGDYLGIGAGAHGKVTLADRVLRRQKIKSPKRYLQRAAAPDRIAGEHTVPADDLPFEFMLNALRLRTPVSARLYQHRTGQSIGPVTPILQRARTDGLLHWDGATMMATPRGFRFLNDLVQRFLR